MTRLNQLRIETGALGHVAETYDLIDGSRR